MPPFRNKPTASSTNDGYLAPKARSGQETALPRDCLPGAPVSSASARGQQPTAQFRAEPRPPKDISMPDARPPAFEHKAPFRQLLARDRGDPFGGNHDTIVIR